MTALSTPLKASSPIRLVIRAGFGADSLHLGQTREDVVSVLGKPEGTTRKYKGQYFLNYPSQGLQADLGKVGGRVKYLYFFRSGVRGNQGANVATNQGIRPGDTQEEVRKKLGEPQEAGQGVVITPRIRIGDWYHYSAGITFEFADDDRIDMITISRAAKTRGTNHKKSDMKLNGTRIFTAPTHVHTPRSASGSAGGPPFSGFIV